MLASKFSAPSSPTPLPDAMKLDQTKGSGGKALWDSDMKIPISIFMDAGLEFQDGVDRTPEAPDINKTITFSVVSPLHSVPRDLFRDLQVDDSVPATPKTSTIPKTRSKTTGGKTVKKEVPLEPTPPPPDDLKKAKDDVSPGDPESRSPRPFFVFTRSKNGVLTKEGQSRFLEASELAQLKTPDLTKVMATCALTFNLK